MTKPENLDADIRVRINNEELSEFKSKCDKIKKPYQLMIREMITAFNEDRVRIIPTQDQKEGLNIYKGD